VQSKQECSRKCESDHCSGARSQAFDVFYALVNFCCDLLLILVLCCSASILEIWKVLWDFVQWMPWGEAM